MKDLAIALITLWADAQGAVGLGDQPVAVDQGVIAALQPVQRQRSLALYSSITDGDLVPFPKASLTQAIGGEPDRQAVTPAPAHSASARSNNMAKASVRLAISPWPLRGEAPSQGLQPHTNRKRRCLLVMQTRLKAVPRSKVSVCRKLPENHLVHSFERFSIASSLVEAV